MAEAKVARKPRTAEAPSQSDEGLSTLRALQFIVSGNPVSYDLLAEVGVDKEDLKTAVLEQASKFAFIASVHAAYQGALAGAEVEVKQLYSELYLQYESIDDGKGKRPTVTSIEASIQTNAKYRDAINRRLNLTKMEAKLRACVEAFRHRKDMLISATALFRSEMEADLARLKSKYEEGLRGGK